MNDDNHRARRLSNFLMATLIVLLTVILTVILWAAFTGSGSTHQQILVRVEMLERQVVYLSCIELIAPTERTPETISECQVNP